MTPLLSITSPAEKLRLAAYNLRIFPLTAVSDKKVSSVCRFSFFGEQVLLNNVAADCFRVVSDR
jgi:hypothetical protein